MKKQKNQFNKIYEEGEKVKNKRGITLIALVLTIIILLILARNNN